MVQNFCEIAENDMNVHFRNKNFVIITFFRDYCYSSACCGVLTPKSNYIETFLAALQFSSHVHQYQYWYMYTYALRAHVHVLAARTATVCSNAHHFTTL